MEVNKGLEKDNMAFSSFNLEFNKGLEEDNMIIWHFRVLIWSSIRV